MPRVGLGLRATVPAVQRITDVCAAKLIKFGTPDQWAPHINSCPLLITQLARKTKRNTI